VAPYPHNKAIQPRGVTAPTIRAFSESTRVPPTFPLHRDARRLECNCICPVITDYDDLLTFALKAVSNRFDKESTRSQYWNILMRRLMLTFFCVWTIGVASSRADDSDDYVKRQMQRQHIPGLSLAVVKDGRIIKAKGYGLANLELKVQAKKDTVYEIGSVTKQFTATAIMMLVEEGKVALDDKITKHLSSLPDAWSEVSIRHLLTHTSGIKNYTAAPNYEKLQRSPISSSALLKTVADSPLEFQPGEKWAYSNTGYYLLGRIIEEVSGQSYAEFAKQRIFIPLGMDSTCANNLRTVITNRASGYSWDTGRWRNADYVDMSWPYAAGSLVSTVLDLAKWDAALYTEKLLPRDRLLQMWTPVKLNDGSSYVYGFGWGAPGTNTHRMVSHCGGIAGFGSCIARWLDDKITVIVLVNADSARVWDFTQAISRRYIPALVSKPVEDTDPQTTDKLRAVLIELVAGKVDPELFTNEMRKGFFPARSKQVYSELKNLGAIKSFSLLEKSGDDKSHRYSYRAVFNKEPLLFNVALSHNGKIDSIEAAFE
jgi:D-alanyl-D-alanine carboxypeptidase